MTSTDSAPGIERIVGAFGAHAKRAALMPYLMAGHPDHETSAAALAAAADAGADLLELGVPFSDPLADGPVIHAAGTQALAAGATVHSALALCREAAGRLPVMLMVYANVVMRSGPAGFALRAAAAGAAGLIVPDLPYDEAGEVRAACDAEGLALVPLVAPTTTAERAAAIGRTARGFVYAVSLTGTTGERGELAPGVTETVARVRAATELPVAVGFGVSTPAQAARVGELADGVIVGSRVVRAAGEGGADGVRRTVAELASALSLPGADGC
ncbi:MAG TPA: tryptophan synthase subunit alpha [Thermoleophilaceae bacterium]|nr:tryptophan synthase subunit alpha [Thermoleophilaceae bacterium]